MTRYIPLTYMLWEEMKKQLSEEQIFLSVGHLIFDIDLAFGPALAGLEFDIQCDHNRIFLLVLNSNLFVWCRSLRICGVVSSV